MPHAIDLFEIVGPIMIGPSSSHTAGAVRIGQITMKLLGEKIARADISLHGSFAMTYKGHGTDRALVGGLLGLNVDDPKIRSSLKIAKEEGIEFSFKEISLRDAHPNTAVIHAFGASGKDVTVRASSVGGGSILVNEIDGIDVEFSGEGNTLVIRYKDAKGAIAKVTSVVAQAGINIATMKVSRTGVGKSAIMVLELDVLPSKETLQKIDDIDPTDTVTLLSTQKLLENSGV